MFGKLGGEVFADMAHAMRRFFKPAIADYINLEANSAIDQFSLVTSDGGLLSVIEIDGLLSINDDDGALQIARGISQGAAPQLAKPGHRVQVVYEGDPDLSYQEISSSVRKMKETAARVHLDLAPMIDERERVLSRRTIREKVYLVLSTSVQCLPVSEQKRVLGDRVDKAYHEGSPLRPGEFAQAPYFEVGGLMDIHQGFVEQVSREVGVWCRYHTLGAREAIKAVRMQASRNFTGEDWEATLLGDRVPKRLLVESNRLDDQSHVMHPSLAQQLFPSAPEVHDLDPTMVKHEGLIYAPVLIDIPPQRTASFNSLFARVPEGLPWRISLSMDTGHDRVMSVLKRKKGYATWLAVTNSDNKAIRDAADEFLHFGERQGETVVPVQIAVCTWGKTHEQVLKRKAHLMAALQGWGQTEVIEERGDAIEAWMNSLPGVSQKQIGNPMPMLLEEALYMSPLMRPCSPWTEGSLHLRTKTRKLYQYMPTNSQQENWVTLIYGPPGKGKSVMLAAYNSAMLLKPGNTRLPRITTVDIGFSSAGWVDMIRAALPDDQKHLATAFQLNNRREDAVNPFDLPLGCVKPLAVDKVFLSNLMVTLLTPVHGEGSIDMLAEMVTLLIDAMYELRLPENQPELYERGLDEVVDAAVDLHSLHYVEDDTSWYAIRDLLFDAGDSVNALRAQRYAVPTLDDALTAMTENQTFRDSYGDDERAKLLKAMIVSATRDYPVLSTRTKFDLGDARIVSIDLQNVAITGSAKADKTTAVMFMMARQIGAKDFYRNLETLVEIPEKYRRHHEKIITLDNQVPKVFSMDELHKMRNAPQAIEQAIIDAREGRKHEVMVTLASQFLVDFDDRMVKLANNVYCLGYANEEDLRDIIRKFGLSGSTQSSMRRLMRGITKEGSDFLALYRVKNVNDFVQQVLMLTLGPMEAWAYCTTKGERELRNELSKLLGLGNALKIMAKEFPTVSAGQYLQHFKEQAVYTDEDNIYALAARELAEKHAELVSD
ncbi:ATP-binding protein [Ferrimonas marina]|uniref:Intracellular multiplication protein IcmB n=1 Tax=Ferrimonas marina TaxID=299255 RepID=A0A1M5TIM4_9GAMM|nr:ATP-binding protein [Ferrimonas marina]SHH50539.1 intracellular multiplication protein IcmB [Ferrimonas marina]